MDQTLTRTFTFTIKTGTRVVFGYPIIFNSTLQYSFKQTSFITGRRVKISYFFVTLSLTCSPRSFSLYDVLDIDNDLDGLYSVPTEAAVKGQDGPWSLRLKAIGTIQLYT